MLNGVHCAHVPSPRQHVAEEAPTPLFRLLTDRFPATVEDASEIGKPAPVAPPVRVPTLVNDEATTFAASVVPVRLPAAAVLKSAPLSMKFPLASIFKP